MLSGGRRRTHVARPLQATIVYVSVVVILLVLLLTLWIGISLGANAIGDWILLPIALVIGEPIRRRLRAPR